jgi:methionyl-tRNA formyltransferase
VTFAGRGRLILHRSRPSGGTSTQAPGTILEAAGDRLSIATADCALDLLEIQAEGKRPMRVREFLAGHPLTPGTRLQPSP